MRVVVSLHPLPKMTQRTAQPGGVWEKGGRVIRGDQPGQVEFRVAGLRRGRESTKRELRVEQDATLPVPQ